MKKRPILFSALLIILLASCALPVNNVATPPATQLPEVTLHPEAPTATQAPVVDPNVLYQDDFKKPTTGWASETFDNYFIGYHEPEFYHVAISSANYKTSVFVPEKPSYTDAVVDVKAFTFSSKTAETGDFRYGIAFRRSGDQFYAFTVSQRSKTWAVLKSTGNGLVTLQEGAASNINNFDVADDLRVDAQGSAFSFYINGLLVAQVTDADYASGEIGFYTQTLDATSLHIHYDSIVVRKAGSPEVAQATPPPSAVLYTDVFTVPNTGWPEKTFDNYFIGYHEPEYYHIAITGANYKTTVFIPDKPLYTDTTIEVKAFTFASKTAESGDYLYGVAFRRSGDQYYAFVVSQRTKRWEVLKSTPDALQVLQEGTSDLISDFDTPDVLRVNASGSSFTFHINDQFIAELDDADYPEGEVGFFAQTLDATSLHIHFDELTVRTFEQSLMCTVTAAQMNIRTGPGTSFASTEHFSRNDIISPTGITSDGKWLKIDKGWIANVEDYISCNAGLDVLPVIVP